MYNSKWFPQKTLWFMQIYSQTQTHQWKGSSTVRSDAFWMLQLLWNSGPSTIILQSQLHATSERSTNLLVISACLDTEVRLCLFSRTYNVCSSCAFLEMNLRNSSSLRFPLYLWKTIFLTCDLMHSTVGSSCQNLAWFFPVRSVIDWNIISVNGALGRWIMKEVMIFHC